MANSLVREGRVWKLGDNINTDLILPNVAFRLPQAEQHTLCFEAIRPGWVKEVRPGDLIVAGENFAMGSGRPVGAILGACGIAGVAAESVNGLGLRNCVNFSLPALSCRGVAALFEEGDTARIDYRSGRVQNVTRGTEIAGTKLPDLLAAIVEAGGVAAMLIRDGYIEPTPFAASPS
jgi:3-isopropylmalate/(R)-2-methylmalate dehydratase small subunit